MATASSINNGTGVSVIIPAFNVAGCIGRALDSVLAQRRTPDEIVVVDDGSTDQTEAVVKAYGSAVRYLVQENAGPSAARNLGIKAAHGELIAFLDSDDVWLPDKLAVELQILERNPDLVWVFSNHYLQFHGARELVPRLDPTLAENYLGVGDTFASFFQALDRGLGWDPTAFVVRREALFEAGLFRVGLNYAEDLDLCLRIAFQHPRVGFASEPLAVHQVDRPDGLCHRQSVPEKMSVLRRIFDEHAPKVKERGGFEHLEAVFRQIVHDNARVLLLAGQTKELKRLLARFEDVVGRSYATKLRVLGALPTDIRNRIYRKAEWRIRGLAR